jgi:hypothetical protein
MTEQDLTEINWTAAFVGFFVDWAFSEVAGWIVIAIMFALQGISFDSVETLPPDVFLATQVAGVLGAIVGGVAAGYVARRQGTVHGVLGSVIGLMTTLCMSLTLGGLEFDVGFLGFIVLNLVGAGYGGGVGERWRARRESDDD